MTSLLFIVPSFQFVTRPIVRLAIEIIDSMPLVLGESPCQRGSDSESPDGEHVLQSFAQAGRCIGISDFGPVRRAAEPNEHFSSGRERTTGDVDVSTKGGGIRCHRTVLFG